MKEYTAKDIRNIGVFGHGGEGKTTLTEAMLLNAGLLERLGKVENGTTTTDFDPEESTDTSQHDQPTDKRLQWGLCGGPGVELRTGIGSFLIEGRYFYGLGNLYNSRKEDHFSQSAPQIISVKLSYLFTINHAKK